MTESELPHHELTREIVHVFYDVYKELGSGFLEVVYQRAMLIALADAGINAEHEVPVRVTFRGRSIGTFRMDLVVAKTIIIECKAIDRITQANHAQLINYLRATDFRVGLILNFGPSPTFKRLIFDSLRKH